jgi:hypothetical protein
MSLDHDYVEPVSCKATNLAILSYMKMLNSNWNDLNPSNYSTHKYKAHKHFDTTIRNYLESKALSLALERAKAKLPIKDISIHDYTSSQFQDASGSDDDDVYRSDFKESKTRARKSPKKDNLPTSGKMSPKNEFPVESVLAKRNAPKTLKDLPTTYKRTKYEELEALHVDMIEMAQHAEVAERRWRALRNTFEFVKSPKNSDI